MTHFYHYSDMNQRDEVRLRLAGHQEWQEKYIDVARPYVAAQRSRIFLQAADAMQAGQAVPIQSFQKSGSNPPRSAEKFPPIYEMRTYQLHPGYGTAPKLREAFAQGLPHKVAADPTGELVFFGYSDIGTLNQIIELWRYPSAQACIQARQASRTIQEWRTCIGSVTPMVQYFETQFLHPANFSIWR